jgi:NADH-quinone oxidoreductase subunit C
MTHIDKYCDVKKIKRIQEYILSAKEGIILESELKNRELTLVCRKADIEECLRFLRDDKKCQFKMLVDLCGVDWPEREKRFDVVYHLLSIYHNLRVRVRVSVKEGLSVPSACSIYPCANWFEREAYDMYGIKFENHPDLRRLLTDYDFDGFPLRKDFPVEGKVEVYYDEEAKRVAYKPVDLPQEYRHFDRVSPWHGIDDPISLAEEDNEFDRGEFMEEEEKAVSNG